MIKNLPFILLILINFNQGFCQIDSIKVTPTKDNSIFSEGHNLSDGAGLLIYAGRINNSTTVQVRRTLIKFDVSAIPFNAQIQSVKLISKTLKAVGNNITPHYFTLHELLSNWREGTSSGLGNSSPVSIDDATRQNTFYPSSNWIISGKIYRD